MDSFSKVQYKVKVVPSAKADQILNNIFSLPDMNSDFSISVLASVSSTVSRVDCSSAPLCATLNREECRLTKNTCGHCFDDYFGVPGDSNTLCVQNKQRFSTSCTSDLSCLPWELCGLTGRCVMRSKSCNGGCSGHGRCLSYGVTDYQGIVSNCTVDNASCRAACSWYDYLFII